MPEKTALLIDGHSLANRAFYALPPLSTNQGVPTGAVYGFLTMLLRFLQEKKPTHIAVAFDHPSPTFRHEYYRDYKATRKPAPDEFKKQIPILKDVLFALNLAIVEKPGYEADDIIGALANRLKESGFRVIILSGDRDCLQLVDDRVSAVLPVKGISQVIHYDTQRVKEDMGVDPAQIVDFKALRGDSSDNIPGVRGIGEKTATSLLSKFGSLENTYTHLDEVAPDKVRRLLEAGKDSAFLSLDLATINTNVPIEIRVDDLLWKGPNQEVAREMFSTLEFHTLVPKVSVLGPGEQPSEAQEQPEVTGISEVRPQEQILQKGLGEPGAQYVPVFSEDALAALAHAVRTSGTLSVYGDVEEITTDFAWPDLTGISDGTRAYAVSLQGMTEEKRDETMWKHVGPLLTDPSIKKTGFDIKWLLTLCFKRGLSMRGEAFDVLVAAYLLDPTRTTYRVEDMSAKYSTVVVPPLPSKSRSPRDGESHFALGALACFGLTDRMSNELEVAGLKDLAITVEFPLIQVLAAMEAVGIRPDLKLGEAIRKNYGDALHNLEQECFNLAGQKFNLGSPKQLSTILFDRLGLKPLKKTKTGYSTDAEVLEALSIEHPLPAKILEYRQYAKIKSTYLDVLESVTNPTTGRIHTTFHQTVTATGRLSSSEPNLQNIPVRGELGRSVRRIFIPDEGRLFLASDYSQIELRIMAHMADDPSMIDAFTRGEDIHARTASEMFNVPIDRVDSELRSKAKAVNFGVIYGISDYGLARNAGVSREEARHFIKTYFQRYPKVKEFMDASVRKAREYGYVVTILGRRRAIPDINSNIRAKRGFAERTAINTPIQGSAADIIKLAMVRIYQRLRKEDLVSRLILQVHDELIFEIPPEEEEYMRELVRSEMEGVMSLKVPLKVDIDVGKSWYDV